MIHVCDDWYIDSDGSNNFTVERKTVAKPKNGKEPEVNYRVIGYYTKLEDALAGLINHNDMAMVLEMHSMEIGDAIEELKQARMKIHDALSAGLGE